MLSWNNNEVIHNSHCGAVMCFHGKKGVQENGVLYLDFPPTYSSNSCYQRNKENMNISFDKLFRYFFLFVSIELKNLDIFVKINWIVRYT